MYAAALFALLPLLASAAPAVSAPPGSRVKIQNIAQSGFCLSTSGFNVPKAGDTVRAGPCSGSDRYSNEAFYVPEIGSNGAIHLNSDLCVVPAEAAPVDGTPILLGQCDFEWHFDSDGTISAAGQCLNKAAEETTKLPTWACNPSDDNGRWVLKPNEYSE